MGWITVSGEKWSQQGATALHYIRIIVGRFFVHLGLNVLPPGRVKHEFQHLLEVWAEHIKREVAQAERERNIVK